MAYHSGYHDYPLDAAECPVCADRADQEAEAYGPDGRMKTFDDFSEAFDYCREADKPVTVLVLDEKYEAGEYKLYPSGAAKLLCSYAGLELDGD